MLSVLIISFYLIAFFFLFEVEARTKGRLRVVVVYLLFAAITLLLLRTQSVLARADILIIPYSQEILALVLSVILFLASYNLYRCISEITDFADGDGGKKAEKRQKPQQNSKKAVNTKKQSIKKSTRKNEPEKIKLASNTILRKKKNVIDSEGYLDLTKNK